MNVQVIDTSTNEIIVAELVDTIPKQSHSQDYREEHKPYEGRQYNDSMDINERFKILDEQLKQCCCRCTDTGR